MSVEYTSNRALLLKLNHSYTTCCGYHNRVCSRIYSVSDVQKAIGKWPDALRLANHKLRFAKKHMCSLYFRIWLEHLSRLPRPFFVFKQMVNERLVAKQFTLGWPASTAWTPTLSIICTHCTVEIIKHVKLKNTPSSNGKHIILLTYL